MNEEMYNTFMDNYEEAHYLIVQIFWSIISLCQLCILIEYIIYRVHLYHEEAEYKLFVKKINNVTDKFIEYFENVDHVQESFEKKIMSISEKIKFQIKRDEIIDLRLKIANISSDMEKQNTELKNVILEQYQTNNKYETQLLVEQLTDQVVEQMILPNNKIYDLEQAIVKLNIDMQNIQKSDVKPCSDDNLFG